MSIISESGQIEKHVADSRMKCVFSSQASRAMALGITFDNADKRDSAINSLKVTIADVTKERQRLESLLALANSRIKGQRLPQDTYVRICKEKIDIKERIDELCAINRELDNRLREIASANRRSDTTQSRLEQIEKLLRQILLILENRK